ncbi:MAG TPA: hypothetical protein VJ910_10980 [Desulfuromonadales bacterium]|nr:hypothetical protein [Desulfuromonadales bacterium]
MFGGQGNFPRPDEIKKVFRGMRDPGDMVEFKETCAAFHGMKKPEDGIHAFWIAVDRPERRTVLAILFRTTMLAAFGSVFQKSPIQPAGLHRLASEAGTFLVVAVHR